MCVFCLEASDICFRGLPSVGVFHGPDVSGIHITIFSISDQKYMFVRHYKTRCNFTPNLLTAELPPILVF